MSVTFEEIRHQPAIAGRVLDAGSGAPVSGALVALGGGPTSFTDRLGLLAQQYGSVWPSMLERADRTLSRSDGHFHFLDLPDGQYTLAGSLDQGSRYGTVQAAAQVARGANGTIAVAQVDLRLPSTTVAGHVRSTSGSPVMVAVVRAEGSGETALSDAQGQYVLAGLEAGHRVLVASGQGFVMARQTVVLAHAGDSVTLDFSLTPQT